MAFQRMAITTAILFFIYGCADRINGNIIKGDIAGSPSKGHYISGVPFIAQEEFYCGPASLAMVMNFYGMKISQDAVAKGIYLKKLKGTLNTDLLVYAREKGFHARYYSGSIDDIKMNVSKNMPLILLLNLGLDIYPIYHYMVVVGFHDEKGFIIAHSGKEEEKIFSYKELIRAWEKTSFGTLLVSPPEKIGQDTLSASGHAEIGVIYESKGENDLAVSEYKKAIQKDPNYALAYFNLGNIYLKKG
ncbi:MAG: PA2778 family cysteine peptidase, partial [Deltaproteobacteria bacterium]|nr:PA2778 family cysteine peptidase [Deltaproteobacteria bacterium]